MNGMLFDLGHPDQPPLYRQTDPETSRLAAEEIKPTLASLQSWAVRCVTEKPGRTSRELSVIYCPNDPRTINRRLGECERAGKVRRGEARRCDVSGKMAATWWPVKGE